MNYILRLFKVPLSAIFFCASIVSHAESAEKVALLVWANEAIIGTYTYNAKTYVQEQKNSAKYFTSAGWIAFKNALNASKLPEAIQKNQYAVSAVAIAPPQLVTVDATHWTVTMPILVHYTNPQYQQQQKLKVTLGVTTAAPGQGVRGYAITSLQAVVTHPLCHCATPEIPNK